MKIAKGIAASALALSGLLAAAQVSAQAFVGGSIGQSDIDESAVRGGWEASPGGLITSPGTVDGKDTGFKIFGGYMFNRNFGVEGAYVNLGKLSYSGDYFGFPVTGGKVEVTGLSAAALGSFPVTDQFSVFGKLGLFFWTAEASDTTGGLAFSSKEDGADIFFGIGVGWDFTRNIGVRAEWERFKVVNDADADLLSIGFVYKF